MLSTGLAASVNVLLGLSTGPSQIKSVARSCCCNRFLLTPWPGPPCCCCALLPTPGSADGLPVHLVPEGVQTATAAAAGADASAWGAHGFSQHQQSGEFDASGELLVLCKQSAVTQWKHPASGLAQSSLLKGKDIYLLYLLYLYIYVLYYIYYIYIASTLHPTTCSTTAITTPAAGTRQECHHGCVTENCVGSFSMYPSVLTPSYSSSRALLAEKL